MPQIILTGYSDPNPLLPFLPGFRDDFNRLDGPLIATTNGRPWTYSESSPNRPDVLIQNGAATVVVPSGATGNVAALVETRSSDGVLTGVLKSKANQAGSLIVRGESVYDCIELGLRVSSNALRPGLYARNAGTRSELALSAVGTAVNDGDRFSVVLDGPAIVVYQNDVPIIATETTQHITKTKAGIYAYSSGSGIAWDSLQFFA
jgi:hypothetical protein